MAITDIGDLDGPGSVLAGPMQDQGDQGQATIAVGAVLFADLSGFRALTQEQGDEAAADAATRFAALVRCSLSSGSRVVKTLGDGVLVVTPDAESARRTAFRIRREVAWDELLPPVHAGICEGSVVWRDGDVFGAAVNEAARLADAAGPWEILEARTLPWSDHP
jgi:class 3 adenylate cyclase